MTLILFDIDGTLTRTNKADAKCYAIAFERTFGMPLPSTDWSVYTKVTDTGIIEEVLVQERGTEPAPAEIDAFEKAFVEALHVEFAEAPEGFLEIPGAKAILEAIAADPSLDAALATGGMRGSATYKLSRIGVEAGAMPGAYANDDTTREGIARCAIERANGHTRDWVYVGDGSWDVRTSAAVGMRFIGIGCDATERGLTHFGARVVLDDYGDQGAFFEAVRTAPVPEIPTTAG